MWHGPYSVTLNWLLDISGCLEQALGVWCGFCLLKFAAPMIWAWCNEFALREAKLLWVPLDGTGKAFCLKDRVGLGNTEMYEHPWSCMIRHVKVWSGCCVCMKDWWSSMRRPSPVPPDTCLFEGAVALVSYGQLYPRLRISFLTGLRASNKKCTV